eukprot:278356_1
MGNSMERRLLSSLKHIILNNCTGPWKDINKKKVSQFKDIYNITNATLIIINNQAWNLEQLFIKFAPLPFHNTNHFHSLDEYDESDESIWNSITQYVHNQNIKYIVILLALSVND